MLAFKKTCLVSNDYCYECYVHMSKLQGLSHYSQLQF